MFLLPSISTILRIINEITSKIIVIVISNISLDVHVSAKINTFTIYMRDLGLAPGRQRNFKESTEMEAFILR